MDCKVVDHKAFSYDILIRFARISICENVLQDVKMPPYTLQYTNNLSISAINLCVCNTTEGLALFTDIYEYAVHIFMYMQFTYLCISSTTVYI